MFALVAGTGYTGRRVLERLPEGGAVGLGRSRPDTSEAFYLADFDTLESFPLALPEHYAVLYTCPPQGAADARLQRFLSLLTPLPQRFVYISTTGVYGDCKGTVVTEESPLNPDTSMSKPRVAAENLLGDWSAQARCDLVILRVPGIYGPGRLGTERIKDGGAVLEENDAHPGNRIHVDDLATCCIAALAAATPAGCYNVGDGDHRSATWFADEVARQAGLPPPRKISRADAQAEFSPARLAFLSASRIVDTTKMREVLGVTPRYANPVDGIKDSLQEGSPTVGNACS